MKIKWVGSPHYFDQTNVPKLFITLHWMVGNLLGTDRAFNGSRKASSTYGIEGGTVHQYVEERDYPFSDGNTYANQHTISIEHAGGWLLPDGTRYKPTSATHETSAQLCADIAIRNGFGKLVVGKNVFPHSHWVATACPGSLDINKIVKRANEIIADTPWADIKAVQKLLNKWGASKPALVVDGVMGPLTEAAIKAFKKKYAPDLNVSSALGPKTWAALTYVATEPTPEIPPVVVPPVEPPVVPPVEPPVDPPIEPPVEPTEPPNAKPAVNKWAALIVGIVGLGTLIAGIISGFFQ